MFDLYREVTDNLVARILAMQNRNPLSSTYGCLDRNFWHFKTIIDFPSATYQQAVLGLAKLLVTQARDNRYYRDPVLAEAVRAGVLYWCRIQNGDGSMNEYYRNDRSLCPTAYTTYAVAKVFSLTPDLFSEEEKKELSAGLLRGARWLSAHTYPHVQNQMIASMNALFLVARLSGDEGVQGAFEARRQAVLSAQSPEGWFPEYGGADIGYSFKALDLLSSYLEEREDPEVVSAVKRLVGFVSHFLHPDGTSGGAYGSRCTDHVFPFGLEYLNTRGVAEVGPVIGWFRKNFALGRMIQPALIDDKYAAYFYFNSYVQAFLLSGDQEVKQLSGFTIQGVTCFKDAGILRFEVGERAGWIGLRRNGVCRIFAGDRLVYSDCGYLVRLSDGTLAASQCDDPSVSYDYEEKDDGLSVMVKGGLGLVDDSLPLVKWIVPFKLFCNTILRFSALGAWFNVKLKGDRIARIRKAPIKMTRQFRIEKEMLLIKDTLRKLSTGLRIKSVQLVRDVTVVHSPSSRFYQRQYLLEPVAPILKEESDSMCRYEYAIAFRHDQRKG
jgi:hypothetical protein